MSEAVNFTNVLKEVDFTITIATSTTLSNAVNLYATTLAGLYMPSAFSGTIITLQASHDGTNFYDVYDNSGAQISLTVGVDQLVLIDPVLTYGIRQVKLKCTTEQVADRAIKGVIYRV